MTDTVAVDTLPPGSRTVYTNPSVPRKPASGVNMQIPPSVQLSSPWSGSVHDWTESTSPSASKSFATTFTVFGSPSATVNESGWAIGVRLPSTVTATVAAAEPPRPSETV